MRGLPDLGVLTERKDTDTHRHNPLALQKFCAAYPKIKNEKNRLETPKGFETVLCD
jgi:hypothetical protein